MVSSFFLIDNHKGTHMLTALAKTMTKKLVEANWFKLIAVMTLLCVQFNVATAQNNQNSPMPDTLQDTQNPASNKWGPPFPYTPDDIQDKLIQILKVPDEELSKEKVEAIFGMKMANSEDVTPDLPSTNSEHPKKIKRLYRYFSQAQIDWYFSLTTTIAPNLNFIRFEWWDIRKPPKPLAVPMCVDSQKLSKAVEESNMGWKLVPTVTGAPFNGFNDNSLYFHRGSNFRDTVAIGVMRESNCMTVFEVTIYN